MEQGISSEIDGCVEVDLEFIVVYQFYEVLGLVSDDEVDHLVLEVGCFHRNH